MSLLFLILYAQQHIEKRRKGGREGERKECLTSISSNQSRQQTWYIPIECNQETTFKVGAGLVLLTTRHCFPSVLEGSRSESDSWNSEIETQRRVKGKRAMEPTGWDPVGKSWRNKHPTSFSTCPLISSVLPTVESLWEPKDKGAHWCNPYRSATQDTEQDGEGTQHILKHTCKQAQHKCMQPSLPPYSLRLG